MMKQFKFIGVKYSFK